MNKNILTKSIFIALLLVSSVVAAEEQYPATDFQPTVVYSDASNSEVSKAETSSDKTSASEGKSVEKAESSNNTMVGLVLLAAVAGGFLVSRKPKCKKSKKQPIADATVYSPDTSGLTGVEKYLQAQNISAATGVEKYLAKKESADKNASLTGVDRYLQNRG